MFRGFFLSEFSTHFRFYISRGRCSMNLTQRTKTIGFSLILLNCVGISGKSVFIPLLYQAGLTSSEIVSGRLLYSIPAFWLLFFLFAPEQDRRLPDLLEWKIIFGLTLISMVPVVSHTIAYSMISSAVASVVVYIYPLFVVVLEWIFYKQKPTKNLWTVFFIVYFGIIVLVCAGNAPLEVQDYKGIIYTVIAACAFSIYLVIQSHASEPGGSLGFGPIGYCAWASAIIILLIVPYVVKEIGSFEFLWKGDVFFLFSAFAVFSTVVPFVALLFAIRLVGAATTALITSITPAMTVVATATLLDDRLNIYQYSGVVIVIIGLVVLRTPKPGVKAAERAGQTPGPKAQLPRNLPISILTALRRVRLQYRRSGDRGRNLFHEADEGPYQRQGPLKKGP